MAIQKKKESEILVPGFIEAPTIQNRGFVAVVTGNWKTGKTHLSLTAPAPIAYINHDCGQRGVIEKAAREKKIVYVEFDYHDSTDINEHKAMWEKSKRAFIDALESPHIRTVVQDTSTEAFELIRMARFGKLNKVAMDGGKAVPYPWGEVNAEFRDLVRRALKTDKVVILTHRTKKEYVDNEETGKRIRSGYGDMDFVSDVNIETWKRIERDEDGEITGRKFGMTVLDCRLNRDIEGMELEEPISSIPMLATQIFPDTEIEEWS